MKKIYDDLWQTEREMRFSTLITHAYLLERQDGNVLFYTTNDRQELAAISEKGGIAFQYISHNHEVDESQALIKRTFGNALCAHERVEPHFGGALSLDVKFSHPDREMHAGNIEVIHTPGHTDNSLCYFYRSPLGRNYLFTGDVIYLDHGAWKTLIMPADGGDPADMARSLKLLRSLEVDVIVTSVAVGTMEIVEVGPTQWRDIVDNALQDLQRGG